MAVLKWCKGRLIEKGHNQQEGLDFFETFSPYAKLVTVKIFLRLAYAHSWFLVKLDVNYALFHENLFEEVYMDLPLDYTPLNVDAGQGEHVVCKLHKSIYGLKHASSQWFTKFSAALIFCGSHLSKFLCSQKCKFNIYCLIGRSMLMMLLA